MVKDTSILNARLYDWTEIEQVAFELKNHKAAIVETDTVMGIIAKDEALIYQIKKRSHSKKLVRFVSSIDQVPDLKPYEIDILEKYWPGGLTIIKNDISYRMPNHPQLLNLIKTVNGVYSSSANISGNDPVKNEEEAAKVFRKNIHQLVIVKGKNLNNVPSTIIDFDRYQVLRAGAINPELILKLLKRG